MRAPIVFSTLLLSLACTVRAPEHFAVDEGGEAPVAVEDDLARLLSDLGVTWKREARELELEGWRNQTEGAVEVLACAPGGKTHEAVLVIDCVPRGLHAGLLALGLAPGAPARFDQAGEFHEPRGAAVELLLRWTDAEGTPREEPAGAWVRDETRDRNLEDTPWIFTGSITIEEGGSTRFAADEVATLASTYLDATSVLELPGGGGRNDERFAANPARGPEVGTPLTLIVRAAREER